MSDPCRLNKNMFVLMKKKNKNRRTLLSSGNTIPIMSLDKKNTEDLNAFDYETRRDTTSLSGYHNDTMTQ